MIQTSRSHDKRLFTTISIVPFVLDNLIKKIRKSYSFLQKYFFLCSSEKTPTIAEQQII